MSSILFVCIGNVCRSPLGERLLRMRLDELSVGGGYDVGSAGVRAMKGRSMHPEAARTLIQRGGTPEGFVARQLSSHHVDEAALVLTATRDLRSKVLEESPRALRRTFTVSEFVALAEAETAEGSLRSEGLPALIERCSQARGTRQPTAYDIEDPIGRSKETFDRVAVQLDDQTQRLARILAGEI